MVLSVTGGEDHPGKIASLVMLLVGLVLLPLVLLYLRARLPAASGKLAA